MENQTSSTVPKGEKETFYKINNQGQTVECRVKNGFSWTVFLWGMFALIIRRQWRGLLFILVTLLTLAIIESIFNLRSIIWAPMMINLYYAFRANEDLRQGLLASGWKVKTSEN
ncbi:DUF2628 domain-containing protein [Lactococcus kimchii]|uniref:DUF2628 domain-containing protein n=1 Tax=Lactococcus sp. S-13 TaxID=2507158 RepID=UPI00167FE7C9|nr:DUF2628 domain-containing protein [Lactococcus sp. S-13]